MGQAYITLHYSYIYNVLPPLVAVIKRLFIAMLRPHQSNFKSQCAHRTVSELEQRGCQEKPWHNNSLHSFPLPHWFVVDSFLCLFLFQNGVLGFGRLVDGGPVIQRLLFNRNLSVANCILRNHNKSSLVFTGFLWLSNWLVPPLPPKKIIINE